MDTLSSVALRVFAVVVALGALLGAAATAQRITWDRVANITQAATQLAELQKARGALGTFQFIANCYKTHTLASALSPALEACLAQDYIHTKVTAAVYTRIPSDARSQMGAPAPESLINQMSRRVAGAFAQYKVADKDAKAFLALVEKHGVPVFSKARFPDGQP